MAVTRPPGLIYYHLAGIGLVIDDHGIKIDPGGQRTAVDGDLAGTGIHKAFVKVHDLLPHDIADFDHYRRRMINSDKE